MMPLDACTSVTSRVLAVALLQAVEDGGFLLQLPSTVKCVCDKGFECIGHSEDRNSPHWTRIRRVTNSNPVSDQIGCDFEETDT